MGWWTLLVFYIIFCQKSSCSQLLLVTRVPLPYVFPFGILTVSIDWPLSKVRSCPLCLSRTISGTQHWFHLSQTFSLSICLLCMYLYPETSSRLVGDLTCRLTIDMYVHFFDGLRPFSLWVFLLFLFMGRECVLTLNTEDKGTRSYFSFFVLFCLWWWWLYT